MSSSSLPIAPRHTETELLRLEKQEADPLVRERIRGIRLLSFSGLRKKEICKLLNLGRTTLLNWSHRYNTDGIDGLRIVKGRGCGRKALCNIIGRDLIEEVLEKGPEDGGLWTGPKLRLKLEELAGHPVGKTQGWKTLRRLGYTIQVPKPANTQASKERQAAFKKGAARGAERPAKRAPRG